MVADWFTTVGQGNGQDVGEAGSRWVESVDIGYRSIVACGADVDEAFVKPGSPRPDGAGTRLTSETGQVPVVGGSQVAAACGVDVEFVEFTVQ